jgi:hypothetical protein
LRRAPSLRFAFGHRALYFDATLDGVDDTRKFHQHAVARGFHDAPAILSDLRVYQRGAMCLLPGDRTCFVSSHEPAVSDHIGR